MDMRLFIAIELDDAGKRALSKLTERMGRPPGKIRWCGPEQMHLTLAFLGSTPAERAAEIAKAMERAAAAVEPFDFTLQRVGGFPELRRPKVIWVGVEESKDLASEGNLFRLQARLSDELASLGFAPEERDFHPHITLGRVKLLDRRADYELIFAPFAGFAGPEQFAEQIVLISSRTLPDGPEYATVATVPLGDKQV
jgi:RNA 2',3'-cyclic 3'-phosphodiesterase